MNGVASVLMASVGAIYITTGILIGVLVVFLIVLGIKELVKAIFGL